MQLCFRFVWLFLFYFVFNFCCFLQVYFCYVFLIWFHFSILNWYFTNLTKLAISNLKIWHSLYKCHGLPLIDGSQKKKLVSRWYVCKEHQTKIDFPSNKYAGINVLYTHFAFWTCFLPSTLCYFNLHIIHIDTYKHPKTLAYVRKKKQKNEKQKLLNTHKQSIVLLFILLKHSIFMLFWIPHTFFFLIFGVLFDLIFKTHFVEWYLIILYNVLFYQF